MLPLKLGMRFKNKKKKQSLGGADEGVAFSIKRRIRRRFFLAVAV